MSSEQISLDEVKAEIRRLGQFANAPGAEQTDWKRGFESALYELLQSVERIAKNPRHESWTDPKVIELVKNFSTSQSDAS